MNPKSQQGFSVLEFSMALPIVLALLLGLFDATRAFRTRSAMEEATKLALRQLVATDGGAVTIQDDTRERMYNWYRYDRVGKKTVKTGPQRGSASAPPLGCGSPPPGSYCSKIYRSTTGGENFAKGFDSAVAEQYVLKELQSLVPQSILDCSNPNMPHCATVNVQHITDDPERVRVDLRYNVPILTYQLFGVLIGNEEGYTELHATGTERMESTFINPDPVIGHGRSSPDGEGMD